MKKNLRKKFPTRVATEKGLDYDLYINFISNGIIGLLDIYLNSSENTQEQEKNNFTGITITIFIRFNLKLSCLY
ncbi:transcriptional regulator [Staphylococcus aureus]|uniref:Transcriptional regulator n=1 Tax=Staphylococcus aureus TaxID=1280 RepID=A0A380DQC7_STAAU|nr:transcriptional regulator [Staphylococcus aureus]